MPSTDITLTLDDAQQLALALALGYQENLPDPADPSLTITNPETAIAYIERWFIETATASYVQYMEAIAIGGGFPITLSLT